MIRKEFIKRLEIKIKEILKGIDQEETQSDDGWWETSTGAKFGKQKLNDLIEIINMI